MDSRLQKRVQLAESVTTAGFILFAGGTPFSIAISQGGLFLAALGCLARAALLRRWPLLRTSLNIPILAYAGAELLSAALSLDPPKAFLYSRRLLLISVLLMAGIHLRNSRTVSTVLAPLFAVSTLLSAIGIFRYLEGPGGLEERIRFTQIYMTTAGILMITMCLGAGLLWWGARSRYRWLLGISVCVMTVCVVFTYTRGVWLGLVGAGAVLFPYRRRGALAVMAVLLAATWFAAPSSLKQRALSSFDPAHPRNVERVHMWSTGIKIWRDYPLTGIGDIGTSETYREYMPAEARELAGHFHNNAIHLAVTVGALGLAAVGWLFWRVLLFEVSLCRRLRRQRNLAAGLARGALGALVAFHIEGLFEWNFGDAEVVTLLWFSVGLALAADRLVPRDSTGGSARPGNEGLRVSPGG